MASLKKRIFLSLAVLGLPAIAMAVTDLRSKISQDEQDQKSHDGDILKTKELLDEKTAEIEKIKVQSNKGIVTKIMLQKKLKEAEAITNDLESLEQEQTQLNVSLAQERMDLLSQIDGEINSLTKESTSHQNQQFQKLQSLINEKERLLAIQENKADQFSYFNLGNPSKNEKEDLVEKIRVIDDLENSMKDKMAMIQNNIKEEQSRDFQRKEIAHFIDEENFFGEQSFITNGLNRKDSSVNLATAALRNESATSNANSGTTLPNNEGTTVNNNGSTTTNNSSTTVANTTATTSVSSTSQSTSFQQPSDLMIFENLLEQIQASIEEAGIKKNVTKNDDSKKNVGTKTAQNMSRQEILQQNLAISQKILDDLKMLRDNLNKQIQQLD